MGVVWSALTQEPGHPRGRYEISCLQLLQRHRRFGGGVLRVLRRLRLYERLSQTPNTWQGGWVTVPGPSLLGTAQDRVAPGITNACVKLTSGPRRTFTSYRTVTRIRRLLLLQGWERGFLIVVSLRPAMP